MRSLFRLGFTVAAALAFVVETSCDEPVAPIDVTLARDGGGSYAPIEAPTVEPDAEATASTARIAHLAPGVDAVDFCYQAARATTFVGPVLGGGDAPPPTDAASDAAGTADPDEDAGDGGRPAGLLAYRRVTKYLTFAATGPIRIAIVEAGARACTNPIATSDLTLDPGKLATVAILPRVGDGGAPIDLAVFTDDRRTVPSRVRVRAIHAALGRGSVGSSGPLAIRAVGAKAIVISDRVDPRRAASESPAAGVDSLGYATAAPLAPPTAIAIGPASTGAEASFDPWRSAAHDLGLEGGSLHTAFILTPGEPRLDADARAETAFEVLWCADGTTSGDETACELVR